jgi:hypothetical protein
MLRRITSFGLALFFAAGGWRGSGHTHKSYEYVRDFAAGHLIEERDLSAQTIETDGTEDVFPSQARKDFMRDFITDQQLRELVGHPLARDVRRGAKLRASDFKAR